MAAIFVLSGAANLFVATPTSDDDEPSSRLLTMAVFGAAGLFFLVRPRRYLAAIARNPFPSLLAVLALISVYWSISPSETAARGVGLLGTTLVGLYLAATFERAQVVAFIGWALGIAAVLSLLAAVLVPNVGVHGSVHEGLWRGIYSHKNTMARAMTLTVTVLLILAYHRKGFARWALFGVAAMGGVLLAMTGSATGLVVTAVLVALVPAFLALRTVPAIAVPLGLGGVIVVGLLGNAIAANQDIILTTLGKDPSLTGRTALWEATSAFVDERPFLGHGFAAFWEPGSVTRLAIRHAVLWAAPHSHNGFRDLVLDLGYVGLLLFGAGFLLATYKALVSLRKEEGAAALWPIMFLSFMVLYNLTESTLLRTSSVFWALYVATASLGSTRGRRPTTKRVRRRPVTLPQPSMPVELRR